MKEVAMTEKEQTSTIRAEVRQKRIGLWSAAIFTILGAAFLIFWFVNVLLLQKGQADLSDKSLLPVVILMFLAGLGGFILIRRDRVALGLWLVYLVVLIPPVIAVLVLKDVYFISFAYLAVFAPISIFGVFPRASRRAVIIATVVPLLAIIGIEVWNPAYRLISTALKGFAPYAIALGGVGLLAFSIRQAVIGGIRAKLSTSLIVITILSVVAAAYPANRSLVSTLTSSVGNNLNELASARSVDIGRTIDSELKALKVLALNKTLQDAAATANEGSPLSQVDIERLDQQWRAADAANNDNEPLVKGVLNNPIASELRKFRAQFPQQVELFLTGVQGVSIASTNRTSDYLQSDEEWWQTAYRDGLYIGQPEYDDSSKTIAMNMAVAVRQNEQVVGVVRTTVNFTALTDTLIAGLFGNTGRTNIFLPDGSELKLTTTADGSYELVQQEAPSDYKALAKSTNKYQTILINEIPVVASSASVTLPGKTGTDVEIINNLNWRVVTLQDQTEAQQPVNAQTRNITILAIAIIAVGAFAGNYLSNVISKPILHLTATAGKVASGDLTAEAKVETRDEIGTLATTFNSMVTQLRNLIGSLEQRVAAATRNLTLAAEVGRSVAQVHDLNPLLKSAVELVQNRFNLYYTQVYLLDPTGRQLILQAGTGTVGQQLLGRHHSLPIDLASLNGAAAIEKHAVIVENTQTSIIHRPNPLLPDTRSEMVVPLLIGERVVGTLDMQSSQAGALNKENLAAFETLAGQLAIAVDNAALLAETEAARASVEAQSRRLIRSGWQDFLNAVERGERIGYTYDLENMTSTTEPVSTEPDGKALVASIPVSNEPVGVLKFESNQAWSEDDSTLVEGIAQQLGRQVENLRLLAQTDQYRLEAEHALQRLTYQGWESELAAHPTTETGFSYDLNMITPLSADEMNNTQPVVNQTLEVLGEKIGDLYIVGANSPREEVTELLSKVGEQLSARVENLRLFEETERSQVEVGKRARQLAAVAEVSTVSSREMDIEKMLNSVVNLTQRQFGLYHAHIFLYDEKTQELKINACGWKEGDEHAGTHETVSIPVDQEQSLVARSARTRQAVIINDTQAEPGWLPNPLLPDTKSELAVPLILGDQVLGVLDVQSDRLNAFSEEDANIQTTLASQVAIALQNARSFTQAQKQAERETMLNVIGQKIRSATTVEAVLQIAARELGHALGAPLTVAQLGLKDKQ
jgi:GAF domain-containing protein/HAMP domain-containing protein